MSHTIILTESQVARLALIQCEAEQHNEVTYYQFRFPCLHFIDSLLRDPNPARANLEEVFVNNNISRERLEKSLRAHSILSSKQRISDDQGDKSAHYVRRYFRNSDNLEAKLREVYDELFSNNLSECCCAGATNAGGVNAQYTGQAFGSGPLNPDNNEDGDKKSKKKKTYSVVRRPLKTH